MDARECVFLSAGRRRSVTAWSLRPRRLMEREQASCSIWPHGRTQKEKENAEERRCQCTTCAVCLTRPSMPAAPALTLPYLSHHELGGRAVYGMTWTWNRIMRCVLISQVSWTDMNNTGYSITHLPYCCHCFLYLPSVSCPWSYLE